MALHLGSSPQSVAALLRAELGGRGWLVREPESGGYLASSPRLAPLALFLSADRRDVQGHEAVFLETGRGSGALFAAVIHKTLRGQAQGGVRCWAYDTIEDFLRDGLRLSLGMTRKSALARLWWGGGKGLIARAPGDLGGDSRRAVFQEYGAFVSELRGCYVTAEDAGTGPADMAEIFRTTRFASCIPPERGGSGNPSAMTAAGVVCAMEEALDCLGLGSLEAKTVVLQGIGNVGSAMLGLLLERGVGRVVASEVCAAQRDALLDNFAGANLEIRLAEPGDTSILAEPCDILAPCALGGVLGPKTIPELRAKMVCGAANNPLLDEERDAEALAERGITYIPDFVANRMGIVSCSNEQYGFVRDDPAVRRHLDPNWEGGIPQTTRRVLELARSMDTTPAAAARRMADELAEEPHPIWGQARSMDTTPAAAARRMADELAEEPHPIWGHRAWQIIRSLTSGDQGRV